jgi:hypothetical protein
MTYGVWKKYSIEVSALGYIVEVTVNTDRGIRHAIELAQEEAWTEIIYRAGGSTETVTQESNIYFAPSQEAVESIRMNRCYKKEKEKKKWKNK